MALYLLIALVIYRPLLSSFPDASRVLFASELSRICPDHICDASAFQAWTDAMTLLSWKQALFLFLGAFFTPFQMAVIAKFMIQLIAFVGAYVLISEILGGLVPKPDDRDSAIAAFLGGLLFGINPSFFIGDWNWIGIGLSYASMPLILWSFMRSVSLRKYGYSILCAFIMAINNGEHLLWAGYEILLVVFCAFLVLKEFMENRKFDLFPVKSLLVVSASFMAMTLFKFLRKALEFSSYSLPISKAGMDAPMENASLFNFLVGKAHMSLGDLYYSAGAPLSFLNDFWPILIVIPVFCVLSIFFYRKNPYAVFFIVFGALSILPFFQGSPIKDFAYWILFNLPLGQLFRTWRIPAAFVGLASCVLFAMSFSGVLMKYKDRIARGVAIISSLLLFLVLSYPLLDFEKFGGFVSVSMPEDYFDMLKFVSSESSCHSLIYLPDMRGAPEWSAENGFPPDLFPLSFSKPAIMVGSGPAGPFSHYYYHLISLLPEMANASYDDGSQARLFSAYLGWLGVDCVVVHDDFPQSSQDAVSLENALSRSPLFSEGYANPTFSVFLLKERSSVMSTLAPIVLVDGGYRLVDKMMEGKNGPCSSCGYLFIDQDLPGFAIDKADIVVSDKTPDDLKTALVFERFWKSGNPPGSVIFPFSYILDHDPQNKWSRGSYEDPHQVEWHPYIDMDGYAFDFDFSRGIGFISGGFANFTVPMDISADGDYVVLTRYFQSRRGCKLVMDTPGASIEINTDGGYDGFLWSRQTVRLAKGKGQMTIRNCGGFNAISAIALIPSDEYEILDRNVSGYLSSRQVEFIGKELLSNPSFERGVENWTTMEYPGYAGMAVTGDSDVHLEGNRSIRLSHMENDSDAAYASVASEWVDVSQGDRVSLEASALGGNASVYRIGVEGLSLSGVETVWLYELPYKDASESGWRRYSFDAVIPENISRIRFVAGAGCTNGNAGEGKDGSPDPCSAWFDGFSIRSDSMRPMPVAKANAVLKNASALSPAPEIVRIDTEVSSSGPSMLSYPMLYGTSTEASIIQGGKTVSVVKALPLDSIVTGFWIEGLDGDATIVIEGRNYEIYLISYWVSVISFLSCASYLAWVFVIRRKLGSGGKGIRENDRKGSTDDGYRK